jgi:hypothetical protein
MCHEFSAMMYHEFSAEMRHRQTQDEVKLVRKMNDQRRFQGAFSYTGGEMKKRDLASGFVF